MTSDLVADMQTALSQRQDRPLTLHDQLEAIVPQVQRAVGSQELATRLVRIALTEVRRTPALAKCTVTSLLGAVMQSAQLRLDPGQPLGHCWLIPMKGRAQVPTTRPDGSPVLNTKGEPVTSWQDIQQVEWWLGYTGIIELARRSGQIGHIQAAVVRDGDQFDVAQGTNGGLHHQWDWRAPSSDRGPIVAAYCHWTYVTGGDDWRVKSIDDVYDEHRSASNAWQWAENGPTNMGGGKKDSPWHLREDVMVAKSMVRASMPYLPSSVDLADGVTADERALTWDPNRPDVPPSPADADMTDLWASVPDTDDGNGDDD